MKAKEELDKLAYDQYGVEYDKLSAFAKDDILKRGFVAHNITPHEVDLVRAVAVANEKIAKLQRENRDLWHDNEELQIENLELRDELENSSGRGTRNR